MAHDGETAGPAGGNTGGADSDRIRASRLG